MTRSKFLKPSIIPILILGTVLAIVFTSLALHSYFKQPSLSLQPSATPVPSYVPTEHYSPNYNPEEAAAEEMKFGSTKIVSKSLGISIFMPKQTKQYFAGCTWNVKNKSYDSVEGIVPMTTITTKNALYIVPKYFFELGGEEPNPEFGDGYPVNYFTCSKKAITLSALEGKHKYMVLSWKISVHKASTDAELDSIIKANYGKTCRLGSKKESTVPGIFDIEILGDGKVYPETGCPINYSIAAKYSPSKQKFAFWNLDQACSFTNENEYGLDSGCLDEKMMKSFRFE